MDKRAKHIQFNTLTCLIEGLVGKRTTVELNNDSYATGFIDDVDAKMNISMKRVRYTDGNGESMWMENFFVQGRKIRYVHIPDNVDVLKTIKERVEVQPRHDSVRMKKSLIAEKRTQQTLKRYQREQQASSSIDAGPSSQKSEDVKKT